MACQESPNATLFCLIRAISGVDCAVIKRLAAPNVRLNVPGAEDAGITQNSIGSESLCLWAKTVREQCGKTTFNLHRYFENGCELMAVGKIHIERVSGVFNSPCSIHVVFEQGRVASFQLLLNTFALEKCRSNALATTRESAGDRFTAKSSDEY